VQSGEDEQVGDDQTPRESDQKSGNEPESDSAPESDVALAARIAEVAGRLLLDLRENRGRRYDEWDLGDEGDAAANRYLLECLADARPNDAVLSEESPDRRQRLSADRVWIIDPLDGTREFRTHRHDWAVHVALWSRAEGLAVGAVAMPEFNEVRTSANPGYNRAYGATEPVSPTKAPVVLVSRSRRPWVADLVAAEIGGVVDQLGSAGAKTMAVVTGQAHVYLNPGGLWEWDAAAPAAVAVAAGCDVFDAWGNPLTFNHDHPWVDGFVVSRPEFTDDVKRVMRQERW
jgi:3'(2'), 5'-bisphosphate nucleotidase